jgi:hypothetical protein
MKPQVFVRRLTKEEQQKLQAGLRSSDALALRRCQILLASSRGQSPFQIASSRAIVEPERKLTAQETRERVYDHFGCPHLEPLTIAKEVA